jgi:hypothetical protein
MKTGDRKPDFVMALLDNGIPLTNLASATSVRMVGVRGLVTVFTDNAPGRDNVLATLTHVWGATETLVPGRIMIEGVVTWPGGYEQTFPPEGALPVDIEDDLA